MGVGLDVGGTISVNNSSNIGGVDFSTSYWTNPGGGVIGWNKSNGYGEMSLISISGGGADGGFSFYDRNAPLVRIMKNGNVGIGTITPGRLLHVAGPSQPGFAITETGATADHKSMGFVYDGGAIVSGGGLVWQAFNDAGAFSANLSTFFRNGSVNFGGITAPATAGQVAFTGGNVGIGTTHPTHLLSVAGIIGAREVVVTATEGADYVFKPDYRLKPLNEVAAFIKEHHHLPEIPSEAEVKERGIDLGDMQTRLLAKVEELTLHMIQADERNKRLEQTNNRVEQQNRELRVRIARLEARMGKEK